MGIRKQYLIPECYVQKIPICDNCNIKLSNTGVQLLSNPPLWVYVCEQCNKEYHLSETQLQGEWKWRTI